MSKWDVGIYLRLSSDDDDDDKLESNSITNQRNLINCEKIIQSEKNNISLNDEILKIYQSLKLIELSEFSLCDRLNLMDKKLKNII